ncbi:MAG: threonylcarbamoyl-AMP synthase [Verrucomicrobia bacterium]|nr:threonylcarbamoyl-AMP synthase [Cytophagales bacterium]
MAIIGKDIKAAKKILDNHDLVAIPTETVYGLAGNALSALAVSKIFSVKNRPVFDPLIVHTYHLDKIQDYITHFPDKAQKLAQTFMPGALTLLLPRKATIPDLVTAGLPNVAIRIPNHALTLKLLQNLDFPLAAPSANPFGYISPTTTQHVENQLGTKIKYILEGGEATIGIESTIVGFQEEEVIIYRLGGISVEAIESIVGKVQVLPNASSNPKAPGMLASHYAPRKPLYLENAEILLKNYAPEAIGYLGFSEKSTKFPEQNQLLLSPTADFEEAARNLFAYLRQLDAMPVQVILAALLPEKDLGRAINDRLSRAAIKS